MRVTAESNTRSIHLPNVIPRHSPVAVVRIPAVYRRMDLVKAGDELLAALRSIGFQSFDERLDFRDGNRWRGLPQQGGHQLGPEWESASDQSGADKYRHWYPAGAHDRQRLLVAVPPAVV